MDKIERKMADLRKREQELRYWEAKLTQMQFTVPEKLVRAPAEVRKDVEALAEQSPHPPPRTSCSERLMSVVSTKIYENNPFRILGLSARASLAEAEKKAEKLMMMKRLGIHNSQSPSQEIDEQEIRDAIDRLRDPWKRIVFEVFWHNSEAMRRDTEIAKSVQKVT